MGEGGLQSLPSACTPLLANPSLPSLRSAQRPVEGRKGECPVLLRCFAVAASLAACLSLWKGGLGGRGTRGEGKQRGGASQQCSEGKGEPSVSSVPPACLQWGALCALAVALLPALPVEACLPAGRPPFSASSTASHCLHCQQSSAQPACTVGCVWRRREGRVHARRSAWAPCFRRRLPLHQSIFWYPHVLRLVGIGSGQRSTLLRPLCSQLRSCKESTHRRSGELGLL